MVDAARFGGDEIYFSKDFLRVPILPQSAKLYGKQFAGLMRRLWKGEVIFGYEGPVGKFPILHLDATFDEDIPHNTDEKGQGFGLWAVALLNRPFLDDMLPVAADSVYPSTPVSCPARPRQSGFRSRCREI